MPTEFPVVLNVPSLPSDPFAQLLSLPLLTGPYTMLHILELIPCVFSFKNVQKAVGRLNIIRTKWLM